MNGKVNGTMENPIDTSAPNPPDSLQNEKEAASEGCDNATNFCENSNKTEDSNHLDSESSLGDTSHSTTEDLENDISDSSDSPELRLDSDDPELPENENSNIIFLENNCGNSNESYPESMTGCRVKSDANDETLHKIMVEKNQEAEQARALGKGTTTITRITEITQEENSGIDSDNECSDDNIFEGELRGLDTISINSDSDPEVADDQSQEGVIKIKDSNIIILENEDGSPSQNGNSRDSPSSEVQEIVSDNDDCVVAEENEKANSDKEVQLLRSSRAIKRKRYNDDMENSGRDSDIEVESAAFQRINKPIVINDTKALVEMAARQMKSNQNHTQKKEPTVVIKDTNKLTLKKIEKSAASNKPSRLPISYNLSTQSLYQSIVARGTTVTPVSSKLNAATQSSSQAAQPSILPSLKDDMFVVEAPSFIVPYVYEKSSVKPFRKFVDRLGKELDEQKTKEEKEKKEKEKQERKEKGEYVESEEEAQPPPLVTKDAEQGEQVDEDEKKKKEKKKRGAEEEAVSWDGSTSTDSEDEILISDDEKKTIIIKDKVDSMEEIKDVTTPISDKNSGIDSYNESSDEDVFEGELRGGGTISINPDGDPEVADDQSQEGIIKIKDSNIIILENEDGSPSQNGNSRDSISSEVQEIVSDNDDCVVAEENEKVNSDKKVQLRRSSRAIKRKRYNDDMENGGRESDIEVASAAFQRKNKPIVINDTKALVEMAARQMKSNQNHTQKKEPTVVIIDTNKLTSEKSAASNKPSGLPISSNLSAQSLYQSIVARGTTVTPVSSKLNAATQSSSQAAQPSILPSLTDDMFVVEAPSFIVPYVYEKPSVKPFREFVDLLGKELDEQKAKEEKELQEKENKEKEKKEKEKQERKEKGEYVESEEEAQPPPLVTKDAEQGEQVDDKKKKKKEKKKRGAEEEDVSWDGSTSTDSEDEILISDDENKTIIIKDKVDSMEEIKDVTTSMSDKLVSTTKSDNYFDCSLGKFFMSIGLNLVQEYVQCDLLKQQTRKYNREKKSGNSTKSTETSIASLIKNIEFSKESNAPYSFPQKKCEFCSFKTESNLAMAHHLETPHMKNNVYKCNFCAFEIRSPHDILYHMEAEHNIRGKLERAPAYHQCANCLFEDNGKGKLARHLIPCAKKFKPETNLAPALEWEPPAKIPKITRSRNNMMGSYQNAFNRSSIGSNQGRQSTSVSGIMAGVSSSYRPRGRTAMSVPARAMPVHGVPILRGGVMVRHNAPLLMSSNYPVANNAKQKSVHQPSISITPLPRQPPPVQLPPPATNSKSSFVICEICDGYIKDLEQLRNHMQWIHKVKIHPKMIYNRPPLNCQKCQFRFFTDQGLERHLLGSHGLVTSSMQEAANKGKDAGRCPVCGRVYQWKLLNHVARDHNLTLKPAHLSYKCTVCTATFGMYKQFENHVYSAHSVVAKRVIDKSKTVAPVTVTSDSIPKPLKINDEITIIPQPVKAASASAEDD